MRPKIERLAFGAGLLACLSWACGTVLSKSLLERFHPLDLLVMQLSISSALLWVLVVMYRRTPDFHDWRFMAAARTMTLIVNGAVHFSIRWSATAPICTLPWEL